MELQATCFRDKPLLVAVYVDKPIKRRSSKHKNNDKENHHHHPYIGQPKTGGHYNRRAELLRYSHCLRESAKSTATSSSPHPLKSLPVSITEQLPPPVITSCEKEEKVKKHQTCFEWVSLLKLNDNEKKMEEKKNITKSFLYKVISTLRRFR